MRPIEPREWRLAAGDGVPSWLRVGQEAIARDLRLAPSAVRRLVAEVRAGLDSEG